MSQTRPAEFDTGYGSKRGKFDENYDANLPPSRVCHVRNLPEGIQEAEVQSVFNTYGKVSFVMILHQKRQAFVEFEDMSGSQNLVTQAAANPVQFQGRRVYVTFSKSQEIDRTHSSLMKSGTGGRGGVQGYGQAYGGFAGRGGEATNILLFTIMNAVYPINVEILYSICSPLGTVLRIVIFRKTGVQALVEFDSVGSATNARQSLDGADIYHGCCTIKIDFSKTPRLNVRKNDDQSWDYTMGMEASRYGPQGGYDAGYGQPPQDRYMGGPSNGMMPNPMGPPGGGQCVVMVYGLNDERFNCEKVFNMFCLYGNVTKIKFLPNKTGVAMVQMSDANAASQVIQHLNNVVVFDTPVNITRSKAPSIAGMSSATLKDGSASVVDYSNSQLNRFLRPSAKNRIYRPSKVLHFFNAPPDLTEERIKTEFATRGAPDVVDIKIFDKGEGAKSSSGLLEYASIEDGVKVVTLCNHTVFHGESGGEFTFKVAFSAAQQANKDNVAPAVVASTTPAVAATTTAVEEDTTTETTDETSQVENVIENVTEAVAE